jgi:hypothetical protein
MPPPWSVFLRAEGSLAIGSEALAGARECEPFRQHALGVLERNLVWA